MKVIVLIFAVFIVSAANAQTNNQQLIQWFAGADIVGTTGHTTSEQPSAFDVREFEFSAFSKIDQTWDGVLTLSYHKENNLNQEHLEIHEGFISSSNLFSMSTLKVGKFFLGFGRINRFHRHDWDFTDAPMVQKSFFGLEGAKDTGIEYTKILPAMTSRVTLALTSGNEFNHNESHNHGEAEEHSHGVSRAKAPTSYIRYAKFFEYSTTKGMEVALNFINRVDSESKHYQYSGLDITYKNRAGRFLDTLVQSEIWSRNLTHKEDAETEKHFDIGGYLYYQKGIDRHHAYGLRLDYYKPANEEHEQSLQEEHASIDGVEVDKELKAVSASYIYTNSEFMRTRLTIEHAQGIKVDDNPNVDSATKGFLQFVFNIGAHPAHAF